MLECKSLLFYTMTIVAIVYEFCVLTNSKKIFEFSSKVDEKDAKEMSKNENNYYLLKSLYGLWVIIGIFSSQKLLFILLLILGASSIKQTPRGLFIDSLLSIPLLSLIFLNRFYFHVDVIQYIIHYTYHLFSL